MEKFLTTESRETMRLAIAETGGNEVFCLGRTDATKTVTELEVLARGNREAVPAIMQVCRPGDVVIHNHPSGALDPSPQDLNIASQLGAMSVGFYIVDNNLDNLYRVVEAFAPPEHHRLDPTRIAEQLAPGGRISKALAEYEDRTEQLRMAFAIGDAFNQNQVALIEAGTGTGKSLAYLVPAILWAIESDERVVVSTNTINLQEQLIRKDLPFLQRASNLDFRYELIKGRSNYLCLRRLESATAEPGLFENEQTSEFKALQEWAEKTADGSKENLSFLPQDEIWSEVCCEADQCSRAKCSHFNSCFFHQARRRAAHADILVVNHALLLADLSLRHQTDNYSAMAVLPPFSRLVLDEAHHLEEVATRYFSNQVTRFAYARVLNRLRHPRKALKGLLPRLLNQLGKDLPDNQDVLYRDLHARIELLLSGRQQLFDRAVTTLEQTGLDLAAALQKTIKPREDIRQRLVPAFVEQPAWSAAVVELKALATATRDLDQQLQELLKAMRQIPDEAGEKIRSLAVDLGGVRARLALLADQLGTVTSHDPRLCAWFEISRGRIGRSDGIITRLCSAPLEVGKLLSETLFERMQTVVLTSATLTVASSFNYLCHRVGLDLIEPGRRTELLLHSPFDFSRQALVAVPTDIPEPGRPEFAETARDLIEKALLLADGRSFVLFTAYSLLRRIHAELAPTLQARGYQVLRQGDTTRHRLLDQFSKDPTSILFATDSFWEGVDVPGRSLEQVIIARLPFRVPTEPVLEARAEAIEQAGGDPFMEYTVPQAVIRFRQGFGRLIRNRTDRGVVMLLDSRVVRRNYGRLFLNSLPNVPLVTKPQTELLAAMADFFKQDPPPGDEKD